MSRRRISFVASTIFAVRGGIPRFNQMLCQALDELAPELDLEVNVFSQDDTERHYEQAGRPWRHLRLAGGGSRGAVVRASLGDAIRTRPDWMLVGFVGMTPIGLLANPFLRRGFGFIAHGIEVWEPPPLSRTVSLRRAAQAYTVSRHTGRMLERTTGFPAERIRWLPNTLERGFLAEQAPPVDPSAPFGEFLTVCRLWSLEKRKGVDHSLTAFARVAAKHPGARYRIVGKGDDKPRLEALAAELGVADRVTFEQDLSDEELAEAYRRCSAFVLPSGQEGFGIVFLEAMRFAKPCIGGNEGGTPEVIDDESTGMLVPFGDVEALERAMERLVADPALRARMGVAGHERLESHFVFPRFRERVAEHLREALG